MGYIFLKKLLGILTIHVPLRDLIAGLHHHTQHLKDDSVGARHARHVNRSARSEGGSANTPLRRISTASHRSGRSRGRHGISHSSDRSCSRRLLLRAPLRARLVVRGRSIAARPFSSSRPELAERGALLPPPRELVRAVVAPVRRVPRFSSRY